MLAQQRVRLSDVDQAAEEVGDLASAVPGVVVLECSGVMLEQQRRRAGVLDLLMHAALARDQLGHPQLLTIELQHAAGLEDEGALAEQAGVLGDLRAPAPAHQHHLDPRSQAGLESAHPQQRDAAVAIVQQRRARAEQRAVQVEVERPAHRVLSIGGRSSSGGS
jgi:hypothetical protein